MKKNVGSVDRAVRIVAGLGLLSLLVLLDGDVRWVGLIGLVPLMTGVFSFCPMYCPLKIDTTQCCSSKNEGDKKQGGACCGGQSCDTKGDTPAA